MKEEIDASATEQTKTKRLNILRLRLRSKRERRPRVIEGPHVGFYLLPNLFTSASLLCAFWAILKAFDGHFVTTAWLVLAAAIFDGLDGRVARLTRTSSDFGMYFDSLADLVAFGVAPAVAVYKWALAYSFSTSLGKLAAFGFVLCGALRLARFNVLTTKIDKSVFVGLPIPGAAGVLISIILFFHHVGWAKPDAPAPVPDLILFVTALLAYLMICTIEYPSFKNINLFRRQPLSTLLIASFVVAVIVLESEKALFAIFTIYALSGPILWLIKKRGEEISSDET